MDSVLFRCFDFAIVMLVFALYILKTNKHKEEEKELQNKIVELNNSLLATRKDLEDITKEHNHKFDPYSSKSSKSVILDMDKDGIIKSVNDYALEFFGYSSEELVGKNVIGNLVPLKDSHGQNTSDLIDRIKRNPRLYLDNECENLCKDGRIVWISWTNRIIYDENNEVSEIRSVGFDITPRKELEEELRNMAIVDPVTGTLNRRQFVEDGIKEMKRAKRYKRDLSVILMTIDKFATLNHEHGSFVGDQAIKTAVQACRNSTRDSDYIGRLADIEFAILLPETPLDGAKIVAQRIQNEVMKSGLYVNNVQITVTTSLSIASRQNSDETIEDLLFRSFNALKANKDRQNTISVAD
ncbi:MAG: sensor domain-containing diguanylate cyclase [Alphaproteobacteria bacterium]|nr:sensor domain-containing diguanylate cyclase [Alphaproteobacteria bacterium]